MDLSPVKHLKIDLGGEDMGGESQYLQYFVAPLKKKFSFRPSEKHSNLNLSLNYEVFLL